MSFLSRVPWSGLRPDADAWYAQKAKELLKADNLYYITFNGQPAWEHTPFPIWMDALAFKLFGVSAYSATLPSALFGTGTVLLTYLISHHLFKDRWVAFFAAIILMFPGYFLENARRGQVDVTLTFMVSLALYAFLRGEKNPKWYYLYGFATGCAVLTKSMMGLFPFVIGLAYLLMTRQFKRIFHPHLVLGVTLGTVWGASWYIANWIHYGDDFYDFHIKFFLFERFAEDVGQPLSLTFYPKQLFRNYWPWFPFTLVGLYLFGKRAIKEKNRESLFVLTWIAAVYGIMGSSKAQLFVYIMSLFPALALVTSKTIGDWLQETGRLRLSYVLIGVVLLTVFLLASTGVEWKQASSLTQKSAGTRDLARVVNINTKPGETLGNFRFKSEEEPKTGLFFFGDRYLSAPIFEEEELMREVELHPERTWIARIEDFRELDRKYPGKLYLIHGNKWYAYFTSMQNRDNISYDFSQKGGTWVNKFYPPPQ